MLLSGSIAAVRAAYGLILWENISGAYRTANILMAAGALALMGAGLSPLVSGSWRRPVFLAGAAGAAIMGIALGAGVLTGVVPCSGPS